MGQNGLGVTAWREYNSYWRPLTGLVMGLEYRLWRLAPLGYHLLSLGLHAACSVVVWRLGRTLFPERATAGLWAALLFAFLPGHVFSVLWVSARADQLCGLLYLLALLAWLRWEHPAGRAASWPPGRWVSPAVFALALAAKEMAISLPVVLLVWRCGLDRNRSWRTWGSALRSVWLHVAVAVTYLGMRLWLFGHWPANEAHANASPLHLLVNLAGHAAVLASPWGMEPLKDNLRGQHGLQMLLAAGVLGAIIYALARYRASLSRGHLVAFLWALVTVLPV